MHDLVQLVIGVPKAKGDAYSIEQQEVIVDLLGDHGYVLDPNGGWVPQLSSIKEGGIYADNTLVAGRRLIGGGDDNVTETMRLVLTGGREYEHIKVLRSFIRRVHDFWMADPEMEPPSLRWQAKGAPRKQATYIFDIAMTLDPPAGDAIGPMDVTLTIERAPYWHGIAIGENPKVWHFEKTGTSYDATSYSLLSGTDFLGYQVVNNRAAFTDANFDTFYEQNQIIIAAEDIPGDAPALVCMAIDPENSSTFTQFLVGRSALRGNTLDQLQSLLLCNGAPVTLTDTTATADTGGSYDYVDARYERFEVSFSSITGMNERILWSNPLAPLVRGDYAVYIRARQVGGSAGDITMSISAGRGESVALGYGVPVATETVSPEVQAGTGNTTAWPLTYMGRISLPDSESVKMTTDPAGGTAVGLADTAAKIYLNAARSTGAGVLYVCDVLLLPVSEAACHVVSPYALSSYSLELQYILDNTGYLTHGRPGDVAKLIDGSNVLPGGAEIRGQLPTLIPGVDNRLYVLGFDASITSRPAYDMTLRVSIVPRWTGVIDA